MTLRQAAELTLSAIDRRRLLIGLPLTPSRWLASFTQFGSKATFGLFPKLLTTTRDQVDLLASDNVVSAEGGSRGTRAERPWDLAAGGRGNHPVLSHTVPADRPIRGSPFRLNVFGHFVEVAVSISNMAL